MQRRLSLGFELLFVVGSVVAALAPALPLFFAGRVLQGGATGCMLVSALPSPTTAAHVRPRVEDETAEPLLPRRRR